MRISGKQGIKLEDKVVSFELIWLYEDFEQCEGRGCRLDAAFFHISENRLADTMIARMVFDKIYKNTCIEINLMMFFKEVTKRMFYQDFRSFGRYVFLYIPFPAPERPLL